MTTSEIPCKVHVMYSIKMGSVDTGDVLRVLGGSGGNQSHREHRRHQAVSHLLSSQPPRWKTGYTYGPLKRPPCVFDILVSIVLLCEHKNPVPPTL